MTLVTQDMATGGQCHLLPLIARSSSSESEFESVSASGRGNLKMAATPDNFPNSVE